MGGSFEIGRMLGIPVRIHFTLLIAIPLFAWIIGSQILFTADVLSDLFGVAIDTSIVASGIMPYILGTIIAFGLFAGVLVHELAHSLVARKRGIRINSITLLILGGIASMDETMPDPAVELPMAFAGPIMSLAVGIVCTGLAYLSAALVIDTAHAGVFVFLFGYLGFLNILLFAFNLIPAFPMDGGRILRAWLAKRMPLHDATRIAAGIGKGFAILFGIIGFLVFNPILLIIAFFIYIGADQEASMIKYNVLLHDLRVAGVMSSPVVTVSPATPLSEVIRMMYENKHLGYPVIDRGAMVGIITLADIRSAPPIDRDAMQVRDVMTRDVITLGPDAPLTDALRLISLNEIGRIPIIEDGALVGIVTRTDILRVMELREV